MDSQDQVSSSPSNLNSRERLISHTSSGEGEHHQELLDLDLSLGPPCSPSHIHNTNLMTVLADPIRYQSRSRRNRIRKLKPGKSETIGAPYPWATTRRATVHNLDYLLSQNMYTISGEVYCKGCQERYTIECNMVEKFNEIKDFVLANMTTMNDRAPDCWMHPGLDNCQACGSVLRPIIVKKRDINWLFLLLGQKLGCCRLS
ncbi:putative Hydroxyproline-rich glycofamily protein [Hibiscus syriacus]|uniref:Hydroxyproline-rich glycofamily protein n=1 Tax=Hibiscus syriacus TaxID=106335 RepID=A0A6A3CBG3_HIBSY|nr:putative Hydroxyproline-rich glycofamily protein [Hibiscus syriacus]